MIIVYKKLLYLIVFWLFFNIFITFLSILYFLCYHILITNKKFYAKDSEGGGYEKTLLLVLLIHTFLFSQIMILKNQDKIIIDNNQTLALNHANHDQKQILKEHNSIDPRVKKLLEEKPKKDSNLSKEDEELSNKVINTIQTIGNVYNAKDNKERDELIRDLAGNYLSLQANTLIQEYLHALNHSINSEFNLNYNDRGGLSGNAKVLLPIMSEDNPKISYFLQSGIGGYDNNRIISHFGGDIRYYPNALALNNSGNIMLGLNLVYDHDFSREHKRISLGFESMLDTMVLTKQLNVAMSVTPEQKKCHFKEWKSLYY
ncbi:hypothetical protein EWV09_03365 [Campylobacter lari]|nr:hypothetical protein [Campylobacter lari]